MGKWAIKYMVWSATIENNNSCIIEAWVRTRIECWGNLLHICWFVITRSQGPKGKKTAMFHLDSHILLLMSIPLPEKQVKLRVCICVCVCRKVGIFKGKSPACIISFFACFKLPFDFECSLLIVLDNVLLFPNFMGFDTTARRFCWLQIYQIQKWQHNTKRLYWLLL